MSTTLSGVPLLGALCVTAGLVSSAEIEHCLHLQRTTYPGTPIGQILVLEGYLSQPDLARMVAQQQAFRRSFCLAIDQTHVGAVGAAPTAAHAPLSALPELGAFAAAELDNSRIFDARG